MSAPAGVREDVWAALRAAVLWRDASDEAVAWLARLTSIEEHEKGSNLFVEGDATDYIAVVIKGRARAIHRSKGYEGRDVVITTYWPSDVIGAVAALGDIPFESDIEAVEALTVALIPFDALSATLHAEPDISASVIQELVRRWADAIGVIKRNASDVPNRIVHYLSELPRTPLGSDAYAVEIPIPRVELAALLATTPETLSRSIHALQDTGLLETHKRMIVVTDGAALLARLGQSHNPTEAGDAG